MSTLKAVSQLIAVAPLLLLLSSGTSRAEVWSDVPSSSVADVGPLPVPATFRAVELDRGALDTTLAPRSRGLNQITVPTADGGTQTFAVVPTQTMAPELAAKYPSIRTYFGVATDGSDARISLTVSERGVDASIFENDRRTVIRPTFARSATHVVFDAADLPPVDFFEPEIPPIPAIGGSPRGPVGPFMTGGSVKVYRFAVPVTGEYSDNHGGTVPLVLAAVVSRVAEINAVWEIDLAVRLELVADNNLLIYLDKDTDPWSDGCSFDNLDFAVIQSTVDGIIGAANYDLGHLFLANLCGGAVGGLVCTSDKARSATGVNARLGILLHEAGHSLGAGHTWNSIACFALVPGNYEAAHAYEPGSGSTILSYIGICDADNLGTESERLLQYHSHSFDQVRNYVENGSGNTCGTSDTSVSNSAPVPDAGADVTLPISTPFVLTTSVTDAEGDPLVYAWEEYDLPPNPAAPSSGVVPFFQVFARQSDPARTFPPIENVVSGIPLLGDEVPSTAEVLNMRIHVWDQHPGAPGVAYDLVQLTFSGAAGPFAVTAPDGGETLTPSATTTVAWNVASTDQPPVSCSVVDIDLSTDGGFTYPTSLAVSTLNDGSEMIMLPDVVSSDARIRVRCAERDDHFFFDISDASFVIWPSFPPCSATDLEVKTLADSGACSLRDSVAQAATGSTITFHPTVISGFEIRLGSQIVVDKNLTIDGGASGMGIVSDGTERVFAVTAGTVEFFDLTISDGEAGAGYGGGIHISGGASLELNHCTVSDNNATRAGGIHVDASTLTVMDSTISNNTAVSYGALSTTANSTVTILGSTVSDNTAVTGVVGGLSVRGPSTSLTMANSTVSGNTNLDNVGAGVTVDPFSTAVLRNVTITGNAALFGGAGLFVNLGTVDMANTVIANNTVLIPTWWEGASGDCGELPGVQVTDNGGNHIGNIGNCSALSNGADPGLAGLADNGGATETHAVLDGSPLIDGGLAAVCAASPVAGFDQRGFARPIGSCDIGAFQRICGDGTVGGDEECDDGALNGGGRSCCASDCTFEPDGPNSCDGELCTVNDTCVSGVCTAGACRTGEACSVCGGTCTNAAAPGSCGCVF